MLFHTQRRIDPQALRSLYDQESWWPDRSLDAIAAVLERDLALGVWDGDTLIGFARAISDGQFRAYIEDVVVHQDYRRRGIAVQMLTQLMGALNHIETVSLFCSAELVGLYEQLGFKLRRSQLVLHCSG